MKLNRSLIERTVHRGYNSMDSVVGLAKPQQTSPNRYGEIKYPKFDPPVTFVAHATLRPSEARLSELGWEKNDVDVMVRVPSIELRRVGLMNEDGTLNFNMEWRLWFNNVQYELTQINTREPFLENIPVYVWIGGRNPNGR